MKGFHVSFPIDPNETAKLTCSTRHARAGITNALDFGESLVACESLMFQLRTEV